MYINNNNKILLLKNKNIIYLFNNIKSVQYYQVSYIQNKVAKFDLSNLNKSQMMYSIVDVDRLNHINQSSKNNILGINIK